MNLRFAPRYDERILDLLCLLDDRSVPMAETYRRVADAAVQLGLVRPGYPQLRRLLRAERLRQNQSAEHRRALRRLATDVAVDLVVGRHVNAYEVALRAERIRPS